MATIISRVGYCPKCAKANRPHTGNIFLAYGSHENCYHVRTAERIGYYGFTPHIYKIIAAKNGVITADVVCGMYGCGVERNLDKDYYEQQVYIYSVIKELWTPTAFPVVSWNSLVMYKKDSLYHV